MYFTSEKYENDMEILLTPANLVTFSGTIKSENVVENDNGKKYVISGSLIDAEGSIVTQTGEVGSETLSTTPVGVLYKTVDVSNGDMPCSLIVEGYLMADRVFDGFAEKAIEAIKAALPNIKFR